MKHKLPLQAFLCGLLASLSGCIFVHVRGDIPDDAWISELADENAPASFQRQGMNFELEAFLWGKEGTLETGFSCAPEDLDAYFQTVCENVTQEIHRRGSRVTAVSEHGPRAKTFEFSGAECGEVEVEIGERPGDPHYPYQLEIVWEED